jgi:hypothetical protein
MSVEVRRWILRLKELMGETQISLPLLAGDAWADTALREIYSMNSRSKTAWAELLMHCSHATGTTPTKRWLAEADKYIDVIGDLYLFIKLSHWFPLVDQSQISSTNATILKGLVWLCSKSKDPDIAFALRALTISSNQKTSGSRTNAIKIGNACCWALANMPIREGIAQLYLLREKVKDNNARKRIETALEVAAKR